MRAAKLTGARTIIKLYRWWLIVVSGRPNYISSRARPCDEYCRTMHVMCFTYIRLRASVFHYTAIGKIKYRIVTNIRRWRKSSYDMAIWNDYTTNVHWILRLTQSLLTIVIATFYTLSELVSSGYLLRYYPARSANFAITRYFVLSTLFVKVVSSRISIGMYNSHNNCNYN